MVQKCTELGLSSFVPMQSDRTNIKNINYANLLQNTIEAAQQSERLDIPLIYKNTKFLMINLE